MDASPTLDLDPPSQIPLIPTRSFSSQSQPRPILTARASSSPNAPYILQITPSSAYYATSLSHPSNAIELFDVATLRSVVKFQGHGGGTSALRSVANLVGLGGGKDVLLSAGKDGNVVVWDERIRPAGGVCVKMTAPSSTPLLSLAVHPSGAYVAAGTALSSNESSILYWDPRQPSFPLRTHSETHSDDITSLCFSPSSLSREQDPSRPSSLLLSGSSDGLLALSDPNEQDPDEAVWRVANWGCSVSQAGFYGGRNEVWAASDMETFSLWSDELDPQSNIDIRTPSYHPPSGSNTSQQGWETDYLITATSSKSLGASGLGLGIWAGSNSGDAALLSTSSSFPTSPPPSSNCGSGSSTNHGTKRDEKWSIHRMFRSGHEGVVRGLFWDKDNQLLITGGEDSRLNVWPFPSLAADDLGACEDSINSDDDNDTEDASMDVGSPMRMDDASPEMSSRARNEKDTQGRKKHRKRMAEDDGDEDGEGEGEKRMEIVQGDEEQDEKEEKRRKGKRARR